MTVADSIEVERPEQPALPAQELQRLWFRIEDRGWTSLVLVPASAGTRVLELGAALVQVGLAVEPAGVRLVDASASGIGEVPALLQAMRAARSGGPRLVLAVSPVLVNPAGIPLTRGADAALLCVELGVAEAEASARAVELIGAERFIGCVALKGRTP